MAKNKSFPSFISANSRVLNKGFLKLNPAKLSAAKGWFTYLSQPKHTYLSHYKWGLQSQVGILRESAR